MSAPGQAVGPDISNNGSRRGSQVSSKSSASQGASESVCQSLGSKPAEIKSKTRPFCNGGIHPSAVSDDDFKNHVTLAPLPDGSPPMILVLKVGTSTLMETKKRRFSLSNLGKFVDTVCDLKEKGYYVVLISSGAVGAGCIHLRMDQRPTSLVTKQAVSAVGQCRLVRLYEDIFAIREQKVAQLLLTRTDLMDRTKFMNFRNTIVSLLAMNVVPIINENDSLATEGLKFGDNDTLAAYVAVSIGADWMFLLTDVDCLYTANPRLHPEARPIPYVGNVAAAYNLMQDDENAGTAWGTGGMKTKIIAAKLCVATGIHTGLCHGEFPERILDVINFAEGGESGKDLPEGVNPRTRQPSVPDGQYPVRPISDATVRNLYSRASVSLSMEAQQTAAQTILGASPKMADISEDGDQPPSQGGAIPTPPVSPGSFLLHRISSDEVADSGPSVFEAAINTQGVVTTIRKLNSKEGLIAEADKLKEVSGTLAGSLKRLASGTGAAEGSTQLPTGSIPSGDDNVSTQKVSIVTFPSLAEMPFLGTIFAAQDCTQSIRDQRRWILSLPVRGVIFIDDGCARAVIEDKKSLFAAGVVRVKGLFEPGDAVAVCCATKGIPSQFPQGPDVSGKSPAEDDDFYELARALVNFSNQELDQIKGMKTSQFQTVLGADCAQEVAHRSNIIFVDPTPILEKYPVAKLEQTPQSRKEEDSHFIPHVTHIPIPQYKPGTKNRPAGSKSPSGA